MAERKNSTPAVKAKSTAKKKKKVVVKSATSKKKTPAVKAKGSVKKKAVAKASSSSKKKTVARKKTTKSSVEKKKLNGSKILISGDERHRMICEAAYLVSLKRNHGTSSQEMDWIHAETVIDMLFEVS
jgi:hypothetical protein